MKVRTISLHQDPGTNSVIICSASARISQKRSCVLLSILYQEACGGVLSYNEAINFDSLSKVALLGFSIMKLPFSPQ